MTPAPPGYELVEELGRGATGTVHLARQVAQGREVAIKRIVGGASSQDPETVLRFERQARLLAQLDHPGVVRVFELLRVGADLYLVMEHVPGTDLRRELAAGAPAPEEAARYVSEIAAALDHAHGRGVVHRDVKPSNVLLGADGIVKVADFGMAALLERQARSRAGRSSALGGLAYMAPELARGDLSIDRRADVYGLGVIAYEMLVGRVPFPVDPDDPYATVRAQMEESPPRPGSIVPGFPPLLEAALMWALEKPPERRPATAGELATALREGLERPPTIGAYTDEGLREPASSAGSGVGAGDAAPAPAERAPGRRRLALALAAAGLLAVAAAVLAAGLARTASPAQPQLQVTAVTGAVDVARDCPRATVMARATVSTNGAPGTVTYEWLRPDGRTAGHGSTTFRTGERGVTLTLSTSYDGSVQAQGVAALHVLSPASVYSPPLRVSNPCP